MAKRWENQGAERIHVIDLDGAINKKTMNLPSIKKILEAINIPVQIGGGIRNLETISYYLDLGIKWVIIGTEAIKNPELVIKACKKYPGQIIVGIDARNGKIAIEGWTKTTDITAVDLAKKFEDCGVAAINFTDIKRDGMRSGINIEETARLAESSKIPVIASGGVSTIDDIKKLLIYHGSGIIGVITGRAIYDGSLDLKEAIDLTKGN
jgi:phosphoribosylformimino-5-aminoimidazole carboxamide ribotide isomerase